MLWIVEYECGQYGTEVWEIFAEHSNKEDAEKEMEAAIKSGYVNKFRVKEK